MTQARRRIARYVGLGVAVLLLAPTAPSKGSPGISGAVTKPVAELPCFGGLGDYELLTHKDRIAAVYFTSALQSADSPPKRGFDVRKQTEHRRLTMFPLEEADKDATVNVLVATDECQASITLKITENAEEAARIVRIVPRPESERAAWERERERKRKIARARPMAELEPLVIVPNKGSTRRSDGPLQLDILHGWYELLELFLAFDIDNLGQSPSEVAEIAVYRGDGRQIAPDVVHVQQFGEDDDDRVALVPGMRKARGFLSLPHAGEGDIRGLTIVLRDASGETLAVASVDDWDSRRQILVPMSDEEIERQKRDEEARGRVSVQVQALGGYIWLYDGLQLGKTAAASFRGLGGRPGDLRLYASFLH